MAAIKECPACGAQNDVILSNCMFCKSSLPEYDIEQLNEEELIQNCSEWIGKYEAIVGDSSLLNAAKEKDRFGSMPIFGKIMDISSSKSAISYTLVVSTVEKYLHILDVKTQNSIALRDKVKELNEKYSYAKDNLLKKSEKKIKINIAIIGVVVVLFFVLMIPFFSNMSKEHDTSIEKEKTRLENIVNQVNTAIASGNYDAAEMFCSQLKWEHFDSYSSKDTKELQKQWDEKREAMLKAVRSLKEKKKD
jgi:flagellar basal body-associated protein FliL